jgi:DNA-directed RNA polymerase subunit L
MAANNNKSKGHFSNRVSEGDRQISFEVDGVDVSIVNALRRVILSEIPNVAFSYDPFDTEGSSIKIFANTCALHNEFLAHRLSLIPLCFSEDQIHAIENGKESYRFVLKKHNTSRDIVSVTSDDFVIYDRDDNVIDGARKERILPANPITQDHVLITRLKPNHGDENSGEQVNVECTPKPGTATVHAAWCPVSLCVFHNRVDATAAENAFGEWLERQSAQRAADGREPVSSEETAEYRTRFFMTDAYKYFIRDVHGDPTAYNFQIESECELHPDFLVFQGLHVLVKKVDRLMQRTKDESGVEIVQSAADDKIFEITIHNEGHTLGNMLQSMTYNNHVRKAADVTYVGYYQSHPLEDQIVLRIKTKEVMDKDAFRRAFMDILFEIATQLMDLADEWIAFTKLGTEVLYVKDYVKTKAAMLKQRELDRSSKS